MALIEALYATFDNDNAEFFYTYDNTTNFLSSARGANNGQKYCNIYVTYRNASYRDTLNPGESKTWDLAARFKNADMSQVNMSAGCSLTP